MPWSSLGLMVLKKEANAEGGDFEILKGLREHLTGPDHVVALKILLQAETQQCQPISPVIFTS